MPRHCTLPSAVAGLVVVLGGVLGAAQSTTYEIKLSRAAVVGQKHLFVASAGQEQTTIVTIDGQTGPAEGLAIAAEITGRLTTLAVTPQGRELKANLTIEKSKCTADSITSEILPAGTMVLAAREPELATYSVNDSPVSPRVARCLRLLLPLSGSDQANDDAIFGTQKRQKLGSAWSMNSTLAADDLFKTTGLRVAARDLTGTTRLADLTSFNEQPALRINGEMVMRNVTMPLPPGVSVKSSEFRAQMSALLPVDPARTDGQMGMTMSGKIECEGETSVRSVRVVVLVSQRTERTLTIDQ